MNDIINILSLIILLLASAAISGPVTWILRNFVPGYEDLDPFWTWNPLWFVGVAFIWFEKWMLE